jgi:hypothetical protein
MGNPIAEIVFAPVDFLASLVFAASGRPEVLWLTAKIAYRYGALRRSESIYDRLLSWVTAPRSPMPFWRLQEMQFAHEHCLHDLKKPSKTDPLHSITFEPDFGNGESQRIRTGGSYAITLTYRGMSIHGKLDRNIVGAAGIGIEILVNGTVIRKQMASRHRGGPRFVFRIRRPVLAMFPAESVLSIRTSTGEVLKCGKGVAVHLGIPHGNGTLLSDLAKHGGFLNKKGGIRPSANELKERQERLLDLYSRVDDVLRKEFDKPLYLMFGTLLGYYRNGDFIPGDDDFDAGFWSDEKTPEGAKREAMEIMRVCLNRGFSIVLNWKGKPFRILDKETDDPHLHIDVCPIWSDGRHVFGPPFGYLPIAQDIIVPAGSGEFRGRHVALPNDCEAFLEAYYGKGWRVPDPSYSFSLSSLPKAAQAELAAVRLTPKEILDFKRRAAAEPDTGIFSSRMVFDLYPLDEYGKYCGW